MALSSCLSVSFAGFVYGGGSNRKETACTEVKTRASCIVNAFAPCEKDGTGCGRGCGFSYGVYGRGKCLEAAVIELDPVTAVERRSEQWRRGMVAGQS